MQVVEDIVVSLRNPANPRIFAHIAATRRATPRAMPRGFSGAAAPPPTPTEYEPGARRQPRGLRGQYTHVQLTPPQHSPVECASSSHSRPSSSAATSEKGSDKSSKASEKRAPLLRPVPRSDASVEKMALAELKELAEQKPATNFPPATEARYAELGGTARLRGWTRTMLPALGAAWAAALALSAALLVAPESALAFLTLHAALLAASGAAGAGLLRLASAAGRASFALAVRACDGRASARAQAAAAAARILTLETQLAQAHAPHTIRDGSAPVLVRPFLHSHLPIPVFLQAHEQYDSMVALFQQRRESFDVSEDAPMVDLREHMIMAPPARPCVTPQVRVPSAAPGSHPTPA